MEDADVTETEWLACTDSDTMLDHLCGRRVYDRKLVLFACACCRRVRRRLVDPRSLRAVETAERYADGLATPAALHRAARSAQTALFDLIDAHAASLPEDEPVDPGLLAADAAWRTAVPDRIHADVKAIADLTSLAGAVSPQVEQRAQVQFLRDIFGEPFPFPQPTLDPAWLRWNNRSVLRLAQFIYEGRRFGDLPRLAAVLEQAGCTDSLLLTHCRNEALHVRGCWGLDLLLGKV